MKTEKIAQTDFGENQIVVYQPDEISRIDVRFERNTVWLTQRQMAELFGCSAPTASRIKKSGIINEAITQYKRTIIVDTEKALALMKERNGTKGF